MTKKIDWIIELPKFMQEEISNIRNQTGVHSQTARLFLAARRVLGEYDTPVTIRQLYYQFVARGMIVNTAKSYMNFDKCLTLARKQSIVGWDSFVDRARSILAGARGITYDITDCSPVSEVRWQIRNAVMSKANYYELGAWYNQPHYVEVWTEKDALAGVLEPICRELGVNLVVARGYCSYTFKREAEARFGRQDKQGIVLYFGDLDPSGWDMCEGLRRDLPDVDVQRVVLNPDQIDNLPSNPVKEKDPRTKAFQSAFPQFKGQSWELDVLEPHRLQTLVRDAIENCFDYMIQEENDGRVKNWRNKYNTELGRLVKLLDLSALDDGGDGWSDLSSD